MIAPSPTLVPPVRLGQLLIEARTAKDLTLATIAARSGGRLSAGELAAVEAGVRATDDDEVALLTSLYGVESGTIVPQRSQLVIDLDEGTVAAAGRSADLGVGGVDDVLSRYLSLVYALRSITPGTPVPLRELDLDLLAEALQRPTGEVEGRLVDLMRNRGDRLGARARRLRRRLIVPAAGILVAITAAGALVLVRADEAPSAGGTGEPAATTAAAPDGRAGADAARLAALGAGFRPPAGFVAPEIGEAVAVTRDGPDDATPTSEVPVTEPAPPPAAEPAPPAEAPPAPAPAPEPQAAPEPAGGEGAVIGDAATLTR